VYSNGRGTACDHGYGFTTAVAVKLSSVPVGNEEAGIAERVLTAMDSASAHLPELAGVDIRSVSVLVTDEWTIVPVPIRTHRPITIANGIRLAADVIDHLRAHLNEIPQVVEVRQDAAPPVATSGFPT